MEHTKPPTTQPTTRLAHPLDPANVGAAALTDDRSYDLAGRTPDRHETGSTSAAIVWGPWLPPVDSLGVVS